MCGATKTLCVGGVAIAIEANCENREMYWTDLLPLLRPQVHDAGGQCIRTGTKRERGEHNTNYSIVMSCIQCCVQCCVPYGVCYMVCSSL